MFGASRNAAPTTNDYFVHHFEVRAINTRNWAHLENTGTFIQETIALDNKTRLNLTRQQNTEEPARAQSWQSIAPFEARGQTSLK